MNITYVKTRKANQSVKDPVFHMLKELLPYDNIRCADITPVIRTLCEGVKVEHLVQSSNPCIIIGCGDAARFILRYGHRFCILINPEIDEEDREHIFPSDGVKAIYTSDPTTAPDMEFLKTELLPLVESIREIAWPIIERIHELIELALSRTDMSPEDFDNGNDILNNLRRYKDTVELAGNCPDCGHQMIRFYVSSPGWTWRKLCGRAGRPTYCPYCKTQHGFWLQLMK